MIIYANYLAALDIEPQHAILHTRGAVGAGAQLGIVHDAVGAQVADGFVHLAGGVATAVTREDVAIYVSEARGPSVVDVGRTIGVGVTGGLEDADNSKVITVALGTIYIVNYTVE